MSKPPGVDFYEVLNLASLAKTEVSVYWSDNESSAGILIKTGEELRGIWWDTNSAQVTHDLNALIHLLEHLRETVIENDSKWWSG